MKKTVKMKEHSINSEMITAGRLPHFAVLIISLFLITFSSCGTRPRDNSENYFFNPILPDGPDPYAYLHTDGYYYAMVTNQVGLDIWRVRSFSDMATTEPTTVWTRPDSGPNSYAIWAPEIHNINGVWYMYYTATDASNPIDENRWVFVLRNTNKDPLTNNWEDLGKVNTALPGIDGNVFEHNGQWYFLYSPYVGHQSGIAIARMTSPYAIEQPEVLLSLPKYEWEKTGEREIMEGPQWLVGPGDKVFIIYSAGACWDDKYGLGWLSARKDADLMDPASWTRTTEEVFSLSPENRAFGPGHNSFTTSPDGNEQWIIYHAKLESSNLCEERGTRAQPFGWDAYGNPDFGKPLHVDTPIRKPSGWNK